MLFLQLFWTFLKIGLFTFGGGVAMVALIQNEVTVTHRWLTTQEFTDILAVSQMTPGPVGINTATYTGYTAVLNAGHPAWMAVCGSLTATLAVIILPVALMLVAVRFLRRHRANRYVDTTLRLLRKAVIGIIAAAALALANADSFGQPAVSLRFLASIGIFAAVFLLSLRRTSPILLMLGAGLAGILLYGIPQQ